jgi:hypothetical protein
MYLEWVKSMSIQRSKYGPVTRREKENIGICQLSRHKTELALLPIISLKVITFVVCAF